MVVKLKNIKTGKYVRIVEDNINCMGNGGTYTRFKVHKCDGNVCTFESCVYKGKYIGVEMDGVMIGNGNDVCEFTLWSNEKDEVVNELSLSFVIFDCILCSGFSIFKLYLIAYSSLYIVRLKAQQTQYFKKTSFKMSTNYFLFSTNQYFKYCYAEKNTNAHNKYNIFLFLLHKSNGLFNTI